MTPTLTTLLDDKYVGEEYLEVTIDGFIFKFDQEDWDKIKGFRLRICKNHAGEFKYLRVEINKTSEIARQLGERFTPNVFAHRYIMDAFERRQVDHINGDTFDNRKSNLRFVTEKQNRINTRKVLKPTSSIYKGVSFIKNRQKWVAVTLVDDKAVQLGAFKNEHVAAITYDMFVLKTHGEYSRTNFPKELVQHVSDLKERKVEPKLCKNGHVRIDRGGRCSICRTAAIRRQEAKRKTLRNGIVSQNVK